MKWVRPFQKTCSEISQKLKLKPGAGGQLLASAVDLNRLCSPGTLALGAMLSSAFSKIYRPGGGSAQDDMDGPSKGQQDVQQAVWLQWLSLRRGVMHQQRLPAGSQDVRQACT